MNKRKQTRERPERATNFSPGQQPGKTNINRNMSGRCPLYKGTSERGGVE
jgi:hypothetical protein